MKNPKVLIVDDVAENLFVLQKILKKLPVETIEANSGNKALALALEHDFALIILDVQMPDMDGYEVAEFLKYDDKTAKVPIIFVTAIDKNEIRELKGYSVGAVDFIFKPYNQFILVSKVKIFIEIYNQNLEIEEYNRKILVKNKELGIMKKHEIEAEQLKAVNALMVTSNHRLNQPLTAILGNVDLLKIFLDKVDIKNEKDKKEINDCLIRLNDASYELASIVKKMNVIKKIKMTKYVGDTDMLDIDDIDEFE